MEGKTTKEGQYLKSGTRLQKRDKTPKEEQNFKGLQIRKWSKIPSVAKIFKLKQRFQGYK